MRTVHKIKGKTLIALLSFLDKHRTTSNLNFNDFWWIVPFIKNLYRLYASKYCNSTIVSIFDIVTLSAISFECAEQLFNGLSMKILPIIKKK